MSRCMSATLLATTQSALAKALRAPRPSLRRLQDSSGWDPKHLNASANSTPKGLSWPPPDKFSRRTWSTFLPALAESSQLFPAFLNPPLLAVAGYRLSCASRHQPALSSCRLRGWHCAVWRSPVAAHREMWRRVAPLSRQGMRGGGGRARWTASPKALSSRRVSAGVWPLRCNPQSAARLGFRKLGSSYSNFPCTEAA